MSRGKILNPCKRGYKMITLIDRLNVLYKEIKDQPEHDKATNAIHTYFQCYTQSGSYDWIKRQLTEHYPSFKF